MTTAENLRKPPLTVSHSSLERVGDSDFKSVCPSCGEGVLLVVRDQRTMAVTPPDRCVSCGQRFEYSDETVGGERVQQ